MDKNKYKKYIITIGSAVLVEVIKDIIVALINKINFKNAFILSWKKVLEFIVKFFTFSIPIWVIIIVIFIIGVMLWLYLKISEKDIQDETWYKKYSSDTYNGIMYEWRYNKIGNQIEMKDITPICRNCKGNVTIKECGYDSVLYCPNCSETYKRPNMEEYNSAKVYFNNKLRKIINEYNEKLDCKK